MTVLWILGASDYEAIRWSGPQDIMFIVEVPPDSMVFSDARGLSFDVQYPSNEFQNIHRA